MYPSPPIPDHVVGAVAWEWYRPGAAELRGMNDELVALRPLTDAGRSVLAQEVTS